MEKCKCADHHEKAADYLENAARHHCEAAKHHEAGKYELAENQAHLAQGDNLNAKHHSEKACKLHASEHAEKKSKSVKA